MREEKYAEGEKVDGGAGTIPSVENIESNSEDFKEPEKVELGIKHFSGKILKQTNDDLNDFISLTGYPMKEAICFFLDMGSVMYLQIKANANKKEDSEENSDKE